MNTQTVSAPTPAPMASASASASAAAVHQLLNNLAANNPAGANKLAPRYPPPPTTTNVLKTNIKPPTTTSTNNNSLSQAADAAETFRNLSATLNSYTISLQNQLNMAAAAKSAANALSSLAAAPTLVQAASVLSQANTLAQTISMYQHQQHHSVVGLQQLQPPQQPQSSMSSISISNSSSSSSSSTCNLNNTLFVGNLHASLQEIDLIQVFRPFGRIVECCKKWLHFGFVKFTSEEEACHAYVTLNGFRLKGRPMRLEFQNRTKKSRIKAILAQAGLGNGSAGPASASSSSSMQHQQQHQHQHQQGGMSAAAVANAMSGNDLLSMSTAFNNHLNSLSFVNSTVAPSSSSASSSSSTSNSGTNTPATVAALLADSLASSSSSSSSSSANLNAYLQALTAVAAKSESSTSSSAMMSFFNPDHLIKFASGVESTSTSSSSHINRNDFGLAALADSSASTSSSSSFEFKLNDELIKDFNLNEKNNSEGDDLVSLLKKASLTSESSSTSPQHDLSSSSDSGCRSSNSFLNDEDSACFSISSTSLTASSAAIVKQQQANKSSLVKVTDFLDAQAKKHSTDSSQQIALDELTISEHMEFTCSSSVVQHGPESSSSSSGACSSSSSVEDDDSDSRNEENEEEDEANESQNSSSSSSDDDSVSECDTSDDASEIPTDTECLNEIDELIEENCFMLQQEQHDEHKGEIMRSFDLYTQVVDNDGSVARKKLTSGIYKSMNQTLSLFIEPNDVLKPMSADEYNEYVLFPNRICDISLPAPVDSSSSASQLLVQIKNPQVFLI